MTLIDSTLNDLTATAEAVRSGTWRVGDLSGAPDPGLAPLGPAPSPLSAMDTSGFGFMTGLVSFLEEPLQELNGNPGAVGTGADGYAAAGQRVSSIADGYGQTVGPETSEWTGAAALEYLKAGADLVGGIAGLGEATLALGEAAGGAGAAVATTTVEVTTLVTEATNKITLIMNQALAAAPATFGMSVVMAIPHCVQVATEYAGRIGAKMQTLLSSAQNLLKHVQSTAKAVSTLTDAIQKISELGAGSGSETGTNSLPAAQQFATVPESGAQQANSASAESAGTPVADSILVAQQFATVPESGAQQANSASAESAGTPVAV